MVMLYLQLNLLSLLDLSISSLPFSDVIAPEYLLQG